MEITLKEALDGLGKNIKIKKQDSWSSLYMSNIEFDTIFSMLMDLLSRFESQKSEINSYKKLELFLKRSNQLKLNMKNFSKKSNITGNLSRLMMRYYEEILPKDFKEKLNKSDEMEEFDQINELDVMKMVNFCVELYHGYERVEKYRKRKKVNIEILPYLLENEELEFFNAIIAIYLNLVKNNTEYEAGTELIFGASIVKTIKILNKNIKKYLKENSLKYEEKDILKYYDMDFF